MNGRHEGEGPRGAGSGPVSVARAGATEGDGDPDGIVLACWTAPRGGAAVTSHRRVTLVARKGVAGDRYAEHRGHWPPDVSDDVTLISVEEIETIEQRMGHSVDPSSLRRNLLVGGVGRWPGAGAIVRVGEVRLRLLRPCDPCRYLEDLLGAPGLKKAMRGVGGVRASITRGGVVRVGAGLRVLER